MSTVLDDFPSFSNINCFVHLYVDILQFLMVSILEAWDLIKEGSPLWGLVGVERFDGAIKEYVCETITRKPKSFKMNWKKLGGLSYWNTYANMLSFTMLSHTVSSSQSEGCWMLAGSWSCGCRLNSTAIFRHVGGIFQHFLETSNCNWACCRSTVVYWWMSHCFLKFDD